MGALQRLKACKTRKDLAHMLGYTPTSLAAIVYKTPQENKYYTFAINKKTGGERVISAPEPRLKKLQSHLSRVLYECLTEIDGAAGKNRPSFGFRNNVSIYHNAYQHRNKRWVLNIDLKDFFPSFNFGRVRGFFIKDNRFSLSNEVATTIAQIVCDGVALPQGAPTSPVISELMSQILDARLIKLAKKHKINYSRYADDITFSTNKKIFPPEIAALSENDFAQCKIGIELNDSIIRCGFLINEKKNRISYKDQRQIVTGLVVNKKVNIQSSYFKKARAMCHSLLSTGIYKIDNEVVTTHHKLNGILNYIHYIKCHDKKGDFEKTSSPSSIEEIYKKFLFFKYFVSANRPLIVTEGKTDPIYLREAIKSRYIQYPALGAWEEGRFKFNVNFFNYENKAQKILDLGGGGSANLNSIILGYLRYFEKSAKYPDPITFLPLKYPVIIVIDNDDGLKPIKGVLVENFKIEISISSDNDFYHVKDNLFIVKTPENKNSFTCIESGFDEETRNHKIDGKSLSLEKKFDTSRFFGKEIFAKKAILGKYKEINFSGFDPLLRRIMLCIEKYPSLS